MLAATRKCFSRGFTLVELLVALTIMAIVMGLLMNSIRFSTKTADAVESKISTIESFHQSQRALKRQLQLATPVLNTDSEAPNVLDFTAKSTQLDFVAPVPGASIGAGLFRVTLRIEDDARVGGHGGRLIMSYRPYVDAFAHAANKMDSNEVVLLDNFSYARFSFFDAQRLNNNHWSNTWQLGERMPDLVRLRVDLGSEAEREVFDLVVAFKATSGRSFSEP